MKSKAQASDTVASYIATFPAPVQKILRQVRATIRKAAPAAVEGIAYGMPAYKVNGKPVGYFAGFAQHIGFYATPQSHASFAKDLAKYKQGKGSVQFPIDKPMPLALIVRMVKFNIRQQ